MKYFLLCLFISINLLASSQEEFKLLQKAAAKGRVHRSDAPNATRALGTGQHFTVVLRHSVLNPFEGGAGT